MVKELRTGMFLLQIASIFPDCHFPSSTARFQRISENLDPLYVSHGQGQEENLTDIVG